MPYIIENATILREGKRSSQSILVEGGKITAVRDELPAYSYMKMNVDAFLMTPAYTILDGNLPENSPEEIKATIEEKYLKNGCTTLLTYAKVDYERLIAQKLSEVEESLAGIPADYAIGIKIPIRILSPAVLRECKKRKLPGVFVEFTTAASLEQIPWGWVREALFPYNCPLIPSIPIQDEAQKRLLLAKWKKVMENERIPSLHYEVEESVPVASQALNRMGIFPWRSSLIHNAELSYNLYWNEGMGETDERSFFLHHGDKLVLTVRRGKIIRIGSKADFAEGSGEHIKVKTHSFFAI
ncbi:hypothetical protein DRW41_12500 [Neobacillus piezotolerans]|uniref:Amidohydrolase-related domain-containing protein n=1 Tax=Neobacillus piezotolerans TaxID=2259171 RepID=A0A3D8GPZ8_9BACI|nr:hypothetical protein [Neobacillus piezotolerans]RDU36352.1 hypothetical protein DRW41_12500 [Neobacillus piezotolerans]